uniref:Secreted protein n=1 Tax=Mesocestoides corti TaxID=53468 RepID=A0A5K3FTF4_MESCO
MFIHRAIRTCLLYKLTPCHDDMSMPSRCAVWRCGSLASVQFENLAAGLNGGDVAWRGMACGFPVPRPNASVYTQAFLASFHSRHAMLHHQPRPTTTFALRISSERLICVSLITTAKCRGYLSPTSSTTGIGFRRLPIHSHNNKDSDSLWPLLFCTSPQQPP